MVGNEGQAQPAVVRALRGVGRASIRRRCRTICCLTNHRCQPRGRVAIAAVEMRAETLSRTILHGPESVRGTRRSFRRRVPCRSGRRIRCLQSIALFNLVGALLLQRRTSDFRVHGKRGAPASRIEHKRIRRIRWRLRIKYITAIAHIHLGLEVRRLEVIVADLEHLPEGHMRIGSVPRQIRWRQTELIGLDWNDGSPPRNESRASE